MKSTYLTKFFVYFFIISTCLFFIFPIRSVDARLVIPHQRNAQTKTTETNESRNLLSGMIYCKPSLESNHSPFTDYLPAEEKWVYNTNFNETSVLRLCNEACFNITDFYYCKLWEEEYYNWTEYEIFIKVYGPDYYPLYDNPTDIIKRNDILADALNQRLENLWFVEESDIYGSHFIGTSTAAFPLTIFVFLSLTIWSFQQRIINKRTLKNLKDS